ncbi:hypothetical protein ACHMW6_19040 [Pseudoduganella sp. UC29_106]|uniref:hypothetical protein n=1 Tax=Pseudoduganella sp. UC29_106 TaxID=3374553 RepID=UPI00375786E1
MMQYRSRFQAGVAMPVMMIILVVMMVSSIFLLRSSTSTTLTTANLAYESALSKAADLGINTAYQYLSTVPNRNMLWNDDAPNGYVATMAVGATQGVSNPAFWNGSRTLVDNAGNRIEYVIHRLCAFTGPFTAPNNCATTAAKQNVAAKTPIGSSLSTSSQVFQGSPQLHYVITARIAGARGGNVMNQAVVMMGP